MSDDDLRFGDVSGNSDSPEGPLGSLIQIVIQLTVLVIVLYVLFEVLMALLF